MSAITSFDLLVFKWHPLWMARVFMSLAAPRLQTVEQQRAGDLEFGLEQRPEVHLCHRAVGDVSVRAGPRCQIVSGDVGRGVGTAQVQLVAEALSDGRLVRVLREHEIPPTELYVAYPSARFLRPAVRAFVDFAILRLRAIEGVLSDPAEAGWSDASAFGRRETASLPA